MTASEMKGALLERFSQKTGGLSPHETEVVVRTTAYMRFEVDFEGVTHRVSLPPVTFPQHRRERAHLLGLLVREMLWGGVS